LRLKDTLSEGGEMGSTITNKITLEGLEPKKATLEKYLKELYSYIDEILNKHNYAIFIDDEDLVEKVFSIVEEIHEKVYLKYFVISSIKIYLGESIIINFMNRFGSTNLTYFFSSNKLQETNTICVLINFTLAKLNTEERKYIKNDIGIAKKILKKNEITEIEEIPDGIRFSIPINADVKEFLV
jgi:hypothetical protein